MSDQKTKLEAILEEAKADAGLRWIPRNLDENNEALLRVIALHYLTEYQSTLQFRKGYKLRRSKKDLWEFMSNPIPELYKKLFMLFLGSDPRRDKKRTYPGLKKPISARDLHTRVAAYMDGEGRNVPYTRSFLRSYLSYALRELYANKPVPLQIRFKGS